MVYTFPHMVKQRIILIVMLMTTMLVTACQPTPPPQTRGDTPTVLAVESFLADVAQNVAGDRLQVQTLMPLGLDPHAFEPTPQDLTKIADGQVLIVNGAGMEEWLQKVLDNAGGQRLVIAASAGLVSRPIPTGEIVDEESDPHFWLDPLMVVKYTETIRDGLMKADPAGADTYMRNAAAYIAQLNELDSWIKSQVALIPAERRLLVTNHESMGYYADRYGFKIIGTIISSVSTSAAPSAQRLAALVDQIKASGARAIFIETGTNPQLTQQLANETGAQVITDLYTHSITAPDGPAPTYIDMLKHNTTIIVRALQ